MRTVTTAALVFAIVNTTAIGQNQLATVETKPPVQGTLNPTGVEPDYVIGAGDVLQISVWQEPQFGETVEVRPDGKISLPLISDVAIAGLTPIQAEGRLTDKLQGFVKRPRVSVVVTEVHSKVVYVIGQVERPGPYSLVGAINVQQLIARAGGTTRRAKKKQVYVLRSGNSNKLPVNYNKVLQGKATKQNLDLIAGDTVVVP
ncbi:MAG TPA: polysaccharide biosynthesis/export family protein [Acidobacteriaceae bacterium]